MNIFDSIKNLKWSQVNLESIFEGCFNAYLVDYLNPSISRDFIKKVATYRLKICSTCHMNNNEWCDNTGDRKIINVETGQETIGCGCGLKCKSGALDEECPASLWKKVKKPV